MSAQEVPLKSYFSERAKTNDVPAGRLIGFEAKDIAADGPRSCWQPDHRT
jgi:hypothetical protein